MSKNCALIVAAGKGMRMGFDINKIFIDLNGKPILYYTLEAFNKHENIKSIVLVSASDEIEKCREIINKYNLHKVSKIVAGGSERQESVFNGLKAIDKADIVLIHDGARPFISENIISNGIKYAEVYGSCACGVKPKDTIKIRDNNNFSTNILDREKLISIQTPQCFKYNLIMDSHKKICNKKVKVTDDTSVTEYFGHKTYIYPGDYKNIKITTKEDLIIGENLVKGLI